MHLIWQDEFYENYITFFRDAINEAVKYKDNPTDIEDQILEELDKFSMEEPSGNTSDTDSNKQT